MQLLKTIGETLFSLFIQGPKLIRLEAPGTHHEVFNPGMRRF